MVVVAQLVRALDCGSRGRRFEPGLPPLEQKTLLYRRRVFLFKSSKEAYLLALSTTKRLSLLAISQAV